MLTIFEFSAEKAKSADWLADDAVHCELVSAPREPQPDAPVSARRLEARVSKHFAVSSAANADMARWHLP